VTFVDEHGSAEAGIDGGGLFKEFVLTTCRAAFDPSFGLFDETAATFQVSSICSKRVDGVCVLVM
jgi:hypothetical protein